MYLEDSWIIHNSNSKDEEGRRIYVSLLHSREFVGWMAPLLIKRKWRGKRRLRSSVEDTSGHSKFLPFLRPAERLVAKTLRCLSLLKVTKLKKLEKKFTNFKVGWYSYGITLTRRRRRRRGKICRSCRFIWIFLPSSSSVRSLTSSKGVISLVFCPAKIR